MSMSKQLVQTIRRVQAIISKHSADFRNNETQTITSLINPILDALGWQTSNPQQVRREVAVGRSNRVDMALLQNQKPVVFLEAKALNIHLAANQIEQIGHYCFQEGVPNAILTNGKEWHIYRPQLTTLPFAKRKLFIAQLGQDERSAASAAVELSKIARENIDQLEDEAWRMLLEKCWEKYDKGSFVDQLTKNLCQALAKEHRKHIREVPDTLVRDWLQEKLRRQPLLDPNGKVKSPPNRELTPPTKSSSIPTPGRLAIVLAGQHILLEYQNQIILEVANWLIKKGLLQQEDCPLRMSGKSRRFLIHTRPQHELTGKPFESPKRLDNGLYIEVFNNSGIPGFRRHAHQLFEHYGLPTNTLTIIDNRNPKRNQR